MVDIANIELKDLEERLSDLQEKANTFDLITPMCISPMGLPSMNFIQDELSFKCRANAAPRLTISGNINQQNATLIVPRKTEKYWRLDIEHSRSVKMPNILGYVNVDSKCKYLPEGILNFADLEIIKHRIEFDRQCNKNTYIDVYFKPAGNLSWSIIPSVLIISDPSFRLKVAHLAFAENLCNTTMEFSTGGKVIVGDISINVLLTMRLHEPWTLKLKSDNLTIGTLANLVFGGRKGDIVDILPSGLIPKDTDVALKAAELAIDVHKPALKVIYFAIVQTGRWEILPHIALYDWALNIRIALDTKENKYKGVLTGRVDLGEHTKLKALIPVPLSSGLCYIDINNESPLHFPGIGNLIQTISGQSITNLPVEFATFGACDIDMLSMAIDVSKKSLKTINFAMHSTTKWVVANEYLEFSNVYANLRVENKGGLKAVGVIGGTVEILKQQIKINASRYSATESWRFSIDIDSPLHIPSIGQLASWALPEQFVLKLPSAVMPFNKGLDITSMHVSMNADTGKLKKLTFGIQNSGPWVIIEKYLILEKARVAGEITDFSTTKKLNLAINAKLIVGQAEIIFQANHTPDKPWTLKMELAKPVSFEFAQLLAKLKLNKEFASPQDLKLSVLTINAVTGETIPEQKKITFSGDISVTSNLEILGCQFNMFNLVGRVLIEGTEKKQVSLGCTLELESVKIKASVAFGTAETPTVFRGEILSELTLAHISNLLVPKSYETVTPSDIVGAAYKSGAVVSINATRKQIAVAGKLDGLGSLFFHSLTMPQTPSENGYVACFSLDEKFKFSALFSGLSRVDELIKIKQAAILISSYKAQKSEVSTAINDLITWDSNPLKLVNPLSSVTLIPAAEIAAGTHVYAQIQFDGWLATLLGQITDDATSSTLSLYAQIPRESGTTQFVATLPAISVAADVVAMPAGTMLKYTLSETEKRFEISGTVSITVFGEKYDFDSALKVDSKAAIFSTELKKADSIKIYPEVLPAFFELKELSLGGGYHFATETTNKYLELILSGKIRLGGVDVSAALHTVAGTPVFAYAKLEKNLSMSSIINDIVGGDFSWPDSIFDITLRADTSGRRSIIYYYNPPEGFVPAQLTAPDGMTLTKGYNVEAAVDLTFLTTVNFSLLVNVHKDTGVTACARLENPINLYIVELASTADEGGTKFLHGPELYINSQDKKAHFGIRTGLNFLGYGFGTADILIERVKGVNSSDEMMLKAKTKVKSVPFFGSLPLNFSYSNSQGLKLDEIPKGVDFVEKVINVGKTLQSIISKARCAGGDVCGVLTDAIFDKILFDDKFKLSLGFDCSVSEAKIYLKVDGRYIVKTAGFDLCDLEFKDIVRVGLGSDSSFDNLPKLVADALGDISESLIMAILSNAQSCSEMIVLNLGKEAVKTAAYLLCLGLIKELTYKAVAAGAAAMAAGGAAVAVATIISTISGGGGSSSDPPTQPQEPATPKINGKLELIDNKFILKWHGAEYAAKYEAQHISSTGDIIAECNHLELDTFQFSAVAPNYLAAGVYKAQVRSIRNDKKSNWAVSTLEKLFAPTVSISIDNKTGLISCSGEYPTAIGNLTYHFKLKNEAGEELYSKDESASVLLVNIAVIKGDFKNVGAHLFVSKEGRIASDTAVSSTTINPPPREKPVHIGVPIREGSYVVIPWTTEKLSVHQRIELEILSGGISVSSPPIVKYQLGRAKISVSELCSGEAYQFRARAVYSRHSELLFYSPELYQDELWTISDTNTNHWLTLRNQSIQPTANMVWRKQSQIIDLELFGYGDSQLNPLPTFDASVKILKLTNAFFLHLEIWDENYNILTEQTQKTSSAGGLSVTITNCPDSPRYVYIELAFVIGDLVTDISTKIKLNDGVTLQENSEWSDPSQIITI